MILGLQIQAVVLPKACGKIINKHCNNRYKRYRK